MTAKQEKAKKGAEKKLLRTSEKDTPVPVVGIGASAGGLEAFETFVKALPDDFGIAYVLVVHLDPSHPSILPEIIQKKTKMKVSQVTDNMKIMPNQVFIIPPNRDLAIFKGRLKLLEFQTPRGMKLPIDTFFRSLAEDQGNKATAIILSGTGTDGTLGIRAIKGEAGMVIVQDPKSAKYDGMPQSAIASGLADYILPPEKMPELLKNFARHQSRELESATKTGAGKLLNALQRIYVLLRTATGHDFSLYKKNTIVRRIERRMQVQQIDDIDDYTRYLQESDTEISILFKELLIGVTSFFRDITAFESLKDTYLPDLLSDKPDDYQVRIWVPGCSSGEEAYSLAIIVVECMESIGRRFEVQIFGTDLDEQAINVARVGRYPESISGDVTAKRLKRFFTKEETSYRINKNIREMVVFAPQNISKDPPFTRIDLLSCRNLLIYFGQELQNKLFHLFHWSLKENGLLFLGSSESVGHSTDLFIALDKKWKIFKCRPLAKLPFPALSFPPTEPVAVLAPREELQPRRNEDTDLVRILKAILAESNMPPCVVIDDLANIVYIHGRTGRFLEPAEGEGSLNIFKMARPGLQAELSRAIPEVLKKRREIKIQKLRINDNNNAVDITLALRPLSDFQTVLQRLTLIIFAEAGIDKGATPTRAAYAGDAEKSAEVHRLENLLQATVEEMETANDELRSTNEELQSTNEELQSTNEELETSKEEMQSLHEESTTVNVELQSRIDELIVANDDIKNLLDATDIATIFLDIDFHVRRYTPKAAHLFHLTAADIGRSIEHFATTLKDLRLAEVAEKVMADLGLHEFEISDVSGSIYRMRVRPYRTINNVIDGVVVTFEDISTLKELYNTLSEKETLWRGLVETAPMGIFIISEMKFTYLNPGALTIFGADCPEEMLGKPFLDRVHQDYHAIVRTQLSTLIEQKKPLSAVEQKWLRIDGALIELVISATPILYKKRQSALIFVRERL